MSKYLFKSETLIVKTSDIQYHTNTNRYKPSFYNQCAYLLLEYTLLQVTLYVIISTLLDSKFLSTINIYICFQKIFVYYQANSHIDMSGRLLIIRENSLRSRLSFEIILVLNLTFLCLAYIWNLDSLDLMPSSLAKEYLSISAVEIILAKQ